MHYLTAGEGGGGPSLERLGEIGFPIRARKTEHDSVIAERRNAVDKRFDTQEFLYGVCYFPEHWDRSMWETDLQEMKDMGMNVVRMGEGAWSCWEPEEGRYDFSLFDEVISLCGRVGLQVILGTPTYAPPAWLTEKYPQVLRRDFYGHTMHHGSRRHYNYTEPQYLQLCERIVTALAEHYRDNDNVIGWQLDNEFNCHMDVSFSESDHRGFRDWCRNRYGTLESLNEAWGTAFWSQTYTSWSQVRLPQPTPTYHNPSHLLDFYRFTSHTVIAFAKMQYRIIKDRAPHQFVTHNGLFDNYDAAELTREALDFMSYDSYPAFQLFHPHRPRHFRDRFAGAGLSRCRGLSKKFIVLEQQAGPGGQSGGIFSGPRDYLHPTPKPGQMRLWVWQSIAHGADGVLFFRWRTCPYGSETLWHGLNHYGNQPNRRLDEAARLGRELKQAAPDIIHSAYAAPVAMLYDYDNQSNVKIERYLADGINTSQEVLFQSLQERHVGLDMVSLGAIADTGLLEQYAVVFYPNAQLLTEEDVARLRAYVYAGGTLIFGPRSGYKDRQNRCHLQAFPGVLEELANVEVTDFTMADPHDPTVYMDFVDVGSVEAPVFREVLGLLHGGAKVLARYDSDYYAGEPAVVETAVGGGRVIYFGTYFSPDSINALLDHLQLHDPTADWCEVPKEVEVSIRIGEERDCFVFMNYMDKPMPVTFYQPVTERLGGEELDGEEVMEPFGVWVISRF